jgi:hypothetical protein
LGEGNLSFVQIKGQVLFKGEIITIMGWGHLKISSSRTTRPILTSLGTNHPLEGITLLQGEIITKE